MSPFVPYFCEDADTQLFNKCASASKNFALRKIAELAGLDHKEVGKAMKKQKEE